MSRILKSFVLAMTVATGVAVPTIQTAQAAHDTTYTVYVWDCACREWVAMKRTSCYANACEWSDYYKKCGYQTCIR
jgi:hypothetical protein